MNNPLLHSSSLPLFDQIEPSNVAEAVDALLGEAERALTEATANDFPAQWSAMARVLDVATEKLSRAWGAVSRSWMAA